MGNKHSPLWNFFFEKWNSQVMLDCAQESKGYIDTSGSTNMQYKISMIFVSEEQPCKDWTLDMEAVVCYRQVTSQWEKSNRSTFSRLKIVCTSFILIWTWGCCMSMLWSMMALPSRSFLDSRMRKEKLVFLTILKECLWLLKTMNSIKNDVWSVCSHVISKFWELQTWELSTFLGRWNTNMMADYCLCLQRDMQDSTYWRKSKERKFLPNK